MSRLVDLIDDDTFNARFPAERLSRVVIETAEGGRFDSGEVRPLWDLSAPPSDDELLDKFRDITYEYLPSERAKRLEELIWGIEDLVDVGVLVEALAEPVS